MYLMQAPAEAVELTASYVRICGAGIFFIVAYNVLSAIFRGLGDSKSPLIFVLVACIVNIFGDLLLVAGFHMDAAGAAIATVAAQAVSVVCAVAMLFESTRLCESDVCAKRKPPVYLYTGGFFMGAGGFEPPKLKSSRFTVCPHWPLGNTPIYSFLQSQTACIYYHSGAHLSTAFYSFFRKEADRTAQSRGRP